MTVATGYVAAWALVAKDVAAASTMSAAKQHEPEASRKAPLKMVYSGVAPSRR
jgi:hypothetical protein